MQLKEDYDYWSTRECVGTSVRGVKRCDLLGAGAFGETMVVLNKSTGERMVIKQFTPQVWRKHFQLVADELRATEGIVNTSERQVLGARRRLALSVLPIIAYFLLQWKSS